MPHAKSNKKGLFARGFGHRTGCVTLKLLKPIEPKKYFHIDNDREAVAKLCDDSHQLMCSAIQELRAQNHQ